MPIKSIFWYAPVICTMMHILYTASKMCVLMLLCRCHWAVVQVCRLVPGPGNIRCPEGAELPSAMGVRFCCWVPPHWCDVNLQTCLSLSALLQNIVDLLVCRDRLYFPIRGRIGNYVLPALSLHVIWSLLPSTQFWVGSIDKPNRSQSHLQSLNDCFTLKTQSRRNAISVKW